MDTRDLGCQATTGLFSFAMGGSSLLYLTHQPLMVDNVVRALHILGTVKLWGALAVMAPGLPRLNERAYAGFVFHIIGAAWSHAAAGHALGEVMPVVALLGVLALSYTLRPAHRRWSAPGGAAQLLA